MFAFVSGFAGASVARSTAFSGLSLSPRTAPTVATVSMVMSKAVPYLDCPPKLDGSLPGDVGFDPLGFSNKFDLNFLREAEVKHGKFFLLSSCLPFLLQQWHAVPSPTYTLPYSLF